MRLKNWNKNKEFYELTPFKKRNLLRVWIKVWGERLNIELSESDIDNIYNCNIVNIDKIFFPNTLFLVKEYLKNKSNGGFKNENK